MIAGSLALLARPVDEPLASFASGSTALDVRGTQEYLDGAVVQHGVAAASVESTVEEVNILDGSDGVTVGTERIGHYSRTATEWVADVTEAGFVVAERTVGTDPTFPFDVFWSHCGVRVEPATIDPGAFLRDRPDGTGVWYSGAKVDHGENKQSDVSIRYGPDASPAGGNIGVGFQTPWNGTVAKGVLYASGYVAIYNDTWGPIQYARFVRDAVLPHADVADGTTEQSSLAEGGACADCGRESDDLRTVDGTVLCPACEDRREEVA